MAKVPSSNYLTKSRRENTPASEINSRRKEQVLEVCRMNAQTNYHILFTIKQS